MPMGYFGYVFFRARFGSLTSPGQQLGILDVPANIEFEFGCTEHKSRSDERQRQSSSRRVMHVAARRPLALRHCSQ